MYALIVTAVCDTDLVKLGYETFHSWDGDDQAIFAIGTREDLKSLVESWATETITPSPWPDFTAYRVSEGFLVGHPIIVRIGKA